MAAATEDAMESNSDSTSTSHTRHVKITYALPGLTPPVYLAGSFTSPPWEPQELHCTKLRPKEAGLGEEGKDTQPEYEFYKEFDAKEGHWQYRFRIGQGGLWVLDENAPIVTDRDGNRINSLVIQKDSTSQAPSDTATIEPQTVSSDDPVVRSSSVHDGRASVGVLVPMDLPSIVSTDAEEPAKPEDLPVKLSEPDIIPPQAEVTVLKERDRIVPQDVEDKTNLVLPGHEYKGGELVGFQEGRQTSNRDMRQDVLGVGENNDLPGVSRELNGSGPLERVEEQPLEAAEPTGAERQTTKSPLIPSFGERKEAVSSTERKVFPIQRVEESVDEFTEVFNNSDDLTLMEGSPATKEPASTKIPDLTEEIPIPFTIVEKLPDKEQPTYGGGTVDGGGLRELVGSRRADAGSGLVVVPEQPQPGEDGGPEQASEPVSLPLQVVGKTDGNPSLGDDFGVDGSHAQKLAPVKRAADSEPDEDLVSLKQENGSDSAADGAVAKHDGHLSTAKPEEMPETEESLGPEDAEVTVDALEIEEAPETAEYPEVEDIAVATEAAEPEKAPEAMKAVELCEASEAEKAVEREEHAEPEKEPERTEAPGPEEAAELREAPVGEVAQPEAVQGTTEALEVEEAVAVVGAAGPAGAPVVEDFAETEAVQSTAEAPEAGETVVVVETAKPAEAPVVEKVTELEATSEALEVPKPEGAPEIEEAMVAAEVPAIGEAADPEATRGIIEAREVEEPPEPEKAREPEAPETAEAAKILEADRTPAGESDVNLVPKVATELTETIVSPDYGGEVGSGAIGADVGYDENATMQWPGKERGTEVHEDSEQPNLEHTANDGGLMKNAGRSHGLKTLSVSDTSLSQVHNESDLVEADITKNLVSGTDKGLEVPTSLAAPPEVPENATENSSESHKTTEVATSAVPMEHKPAIKGELKGKVSVEHPPPGNNESGSHVVTTNTKEESPRTMFLGDAVDASGVAIVAALSQTETIGSAVFPAAGIGKDSIGVCVCPGPEAVTGNEPCEGPQIIEESPGTTGKPRKENLAEVPEVVDTPINIMAAEVGNLGVDPEIVDRSPKMGMLKGDSTRVPDDVNESPETKETKEGSVVEFPDSVNGSPEMETLKEEDPKNATDINPKTVIVKGEDSSEVPEVVKGPINGAHQYCEATTSPEAVHVKKVENKLLDEVKRGDEFGELAPEANVALVESAPAPTRRDPPPYTDRAVIDSVDTAVELDGPAENLGHQLQDEPVLNSALGKGKSSILTTDIANTATEIANSTKSIGGDQHISQAGLSLPMYGAAVGHDHETDSPRIEDAPLFAHECLTPCEEQPLDRKHRLGTSVLGSETPAEPEAPSAVDLEDPLLEASPSDHEHILERLRTTESRLEEDETLVDGIPQSPVLSNGNGSQSNDLATGQSPPPLVEQSPNLDAIREEEAPTSTSQAPILPEAASTVLESDEDQITSIAVVSASAVLAGVTAAAIADCPGGSPDEGTSQNEHFDDLPSAEPSGAAPGSVRVVPLTVGIEVGRSVSPVFDASEAAQDTLVVLASTSPEEDILRPPQTDVSAESPSSLLERPEVDKVTEEAEPDPAAELYTRADAKAQPRPKSGPASHDLTSDESPGKSGPAILENAKAPVISSVAPTSSTAASPAEAGLEPHDTTSDVPEAVKSQTKAHWLENVNALPDTVKDRAIVEGELKSHVSPESPTHEDIAQGDAGVGILFEGPILSTVARTENIHRAPNDTAFKSSHIVLGSHAEARIPGQTNTPAIGTEDKTFAEGGLGPEVLLEQGASIGTVSGDNDNDISAKKSAKAIPGAVIGTAVLVGAASTVKASAKGKLSDNLQNATSSSTGEEAKAEPQLVGQGHIIVKSAQEQGTLTEVSAASEATEESKHDATEAYSPDNTPACETTGAGNGATQVKSNDMDGAGEDTLEGGLRQRKVATDVGDCSRTTHSLQSTKAAKHSNIFKTFWRTVFGGWIGGLFTKIFSNKRHRE